MDKALDFSKPQVVPLRRELKIDGVKGIVIGNTA